MIAANDNRPHWWKVADVVEHVVFEVGHDVDSILSGRTRKLLWARYAIAWLASYYTRKTYCEIGEAVGDRKVRDVATDVQRARRLRRSDERFRQFTDHLNLLLVAA